MSYIKRSDYETLQSNYPGWQQKAFENLRHSMTDSENFFTQYKINNSRQLIYITFMHQDGIGSSRILLREELAPAFPEGYQIAFPDRSCALIISNNATKSELKEIRKMVFGMYKKCTTPISGDLFTPDQFTLPPSWIKPIDDDWSNTLSNEIIKLRAL